MIQDQEILRNVKRRARRDYASLKEARSDAPGVVWDAIFDLATRADSWTEEDIKSRLLFSLNEEPQRILGILMQLTVCSREKRDEMLDRFLANARKHPEDGLKAAASILKLGPKYPHDSRLIAFAQENYDLNPAAAWWIFVYVSRLGPSLLGQDLLDWLDLHHEDGGTHWFEILAGRMPGLEWATKRYLDTFEGNPAAAISAAAFGLTGDPIRPLVKKHFDANQEKAWEFYRRMAVNHPESFPIEDLDFLEARMAEAPDPMFQILGGLAAQEKPRRRLVRLIADYPEVGINRAYYVFTNNPERMSGPVLDAVCKHFEASAYHAFDILGNALAKRPELVRQSHVRRAFDAIPHATNWAFGFFKELMRVRPNEARICVMALFECLGCEPPNRAHNRAEMARALANIAGSSHIETALGRLLREPPSVGSRRSRGLMAILFRQQLHAKQAVLIDALRMAATACTRRDLGRTPLWDFLQLLLDESGEDAVSTATAERFLEASYQLSYLVETGAEHEEMIARFDVAETPPAEWPEGFRVFNQDKDLCRLLGVVRELAKRHGRELSLRPLEEFSRRVQKAEKEREVLARKLAAAKQERLEARLANLDAAIEAWSRPEIAPAMNGEEVEMTPEVSKRHDKSVHELRKALRDALRADLRRLSVETVEEARQKLYASRIRKILGKEPPMDCVETSILPALLFFPSLNNLPNNRKGLARLIGDRIEGRSHDWLWTEPEPAAWAEKVRKSFPDIKLDRWRSRFEKSYAYRPENAAAERKRRIKADLSQARELLEEAGAEGIARGDLEELSEVLVTLRTPSEEEGWTPPPEDILQEVSMNLERVRNLLEAPESDYEGQLKFEVETDPFGILFMGEYGFASCLSLRGSQTWSAVSNAIDIDKSIVWARDPGGNVVGRRLLALLPEGVISYRTYTNRHGLALDPLFDDFIQALAAHIGTAVTRQGKPGPLLSDKWYDDRPV